MSRIYPSKLQQMELHRTPPGAPDMRATQQKRERADNLRQQKMFKLGGTPGRKLMTGAVRKDKKNPNDYQSTRDNDARRKLLFKESATHVVRAESIHYSNKGVTIGTQLRYVDNSTRNVSAPEHGQWLDVSGWTQEECWRLGDIIAASFEKNPDLPRAFARDLARPSDGLVDILRKAHCPPAMLNRLFPF